MKDSTPFLATVAAGTNVSAILVGWFTEYNPVLQGLVYLFAIVTSIVMLVSFCFRAAKFGIENVKPPSIGDN